MNSMLTTDFFQTEPVNKGNQLDGKQVKSSDSAFHSNLLKSRFPKFPPQMLLLSTVIPSNSRFVFMCFKSKYKVQCSLTTEQNLRSFTEATQQKTSSRNKVKYFKPQK